MDVESGDAAPIEETLADGEQGESADPTPANPPPSKVETAPVMPDAPVPDVPM